MAAVTTSRYCTRELAAARKSARTIVTAELRDWPEGTFEDVIRLAIANVRRGEWIGLGATPSAVEEAIASFRRQDFGLRAPSMTIRSESGFGLIEALITAAITATIIAVTATAMLSFARLGAGLSLVAQQTTEAQTRLARCEAASRDWREGTPECDGVTLELEEEITGPFSGLVCGTFRLEAAIGSSGRSLSVIQHEPTCLAVWAEFAPLVPEDEEEQP